MEAKKKIRLYKLLGLLLSTLPACLMTLHYFPLWLSEEKSCISVVSLILLLICASPLKRVLKQAFQSPSPWMGWLLIWVTLTVFEHISRGVRAVAAVAFPFSLLGAVMYHKAKQIEQEIKENE